MPAGAASVTRFVIAIPGSVGHHLAQPWSEKREVYKGWWVAVKKEAKHYWVSGYACLGVLPRAAWNCL